jgi:hypothetical protein
MSEATDTTPVQNIGQNARSGIDHEPLTPREPSTLAGHPTNRRMPDAEDVDLGRDQDATDDDGPEVLRGQALDDALEAADLSKSGTADEKRARLAEHQAGQ